MPSISDMAKKIRADAARKGVLSTFLSFITNAAALSAMVVAVAVLILLSVAYVRKRQDPRPMIVVQPFEEATETTKKCGMTGKNAEDILVDRLNDLATAASHFHGNVNTSKNALGTLAEQPKIPVETAYGITLHGISLDDVVKLYDRVRYEQWNITGDVLAENDTCDVRVRLTTTTSSSGWNIPVPKGGSLSTTVQLATVKLITSANPELAGRALLQEIVEQKNSGTEPGASYAAAEDAFREWINSRPQDLSAYFYLMTTFIYEGKPNAATDVSNWVHEGIAVAGRVRAAEQKTWRGAPPTDRAGAKNQVSSMEDNIQSVAAAAKVTEDTSTEELIAIKGELDRLRKKYPMDTKYVVNSAVASERIADNVVFAARGRPLTAQESEEVSRRLNEAVQLLLDAANLDPMNPGLHRNLGIELNDLNRLQGRSSSQEAIDEYKFALHLMPSLNDAYEDVLPLLPPDEAQQLSETIPLFRLVTVKQVVVAPPPKLSVGRERKVAAGRPAK